MSLILFSHNNRNEQFHQISGHPPHTWSKDTTAGGWSWACGSHSPLPGFTWGLAWWSEQRCDGDCDLISFRSLGKSLTSAILQGCRIAFDSFSWPEEVSFRDFKFAFPSLIARGHRTRYQLPRALVSVIYFGSAEMVLNGSVGLVWPTGCQMWSRFHLLCGFSMPQL